MAVGAKLIVGLKFLGGLVLIATVLLVIAVNFSAVESRFECSGSIASDGNKEPLTLFMKLQRYRWWVGLWSDSEGIVWIEVPSQTVDYINHIDEVGDQLQFFDDDYRGKKEMRGNFSTLSKYLSVSVGGFGFFDGECKTIDDA